MLNSDETVHILQETWARCLSLIGSQILVQLYLIQTLHRWCLCRVEELRFFLRSLFLGKSFEWKYQVDDDSSEVEVKCWEPDNMYTDYPKILKIPWKSNLISTVERIARLCPDLVTVKVLMEFELQRAGNTEYGGGGGLYILLKLLPVRLRLT